MMQANIFYLLRDNKVEWQLKESNVPLPDHTVITRLILKMEKSAVEVLIDSETETTFFETQADRIKMKPFNLSAEKKTELAAGNYTVRLVVYDASNPNGLVWIDGRSIKVIN